MKRMCLSQANSDLAEAAEKLEAIRKKLAVSSLDHCFLFFRLSALNALFSFFYYFCLM